MRTISVQRLANLSVPGRIRTRRYIVEENHFGSGGLQDPTATGPLTIYMVKENHIGLEVNEILHYSRQTKIPLLLYYL